MESNPSEPIGFMRTFSIENIHRELFDNEGNPFTNVFTMGTDYTIVEFNDWPHSKDPQVTGIMLYQSEGVIPFQGGRVNVDALTYRRIDYIPRVESSSYTGQSATQEVWATKPQLRTDNDVLPTTERIQVYNDRIFAPTEDGLRFSDVDGTKLRQWAFPKANAIRRLGVRDCVAHRGVLLFGGATDLHSVTGTGPYNFVVNRLGSVGPVSAHAMQVLTDTVAFVGAAGFYATDGVNVQKLSDPLDRAFEGYRVTSGHCHQLPDDSWIFIAEQIHDIAAERQVAYHFDKGWFSWPRFDVRQIARWRVPGVRVMMADNSPVLRELVWKVTPDVADDDAKDVADYIDWHWESQRLNFGSERLKSFRELQIEGQALSLVPSSEEQARLTQGEATHLNVQAWSLGDVVFGLNRELWGSADLASRVRLTVWVDDNPPIYHIFEMRHDDYRPQRIQLNRKGKAVRFRLEGRGHLHLRALTLVGAQ